MPRRSDQKHHLVESDTHLHILSLKHKQQTGFVQAFVEPIIKSGEILPLLSMIPFEELQLSISSASTESILAVILTLFNQAATSNPLSPLQSRLVSVFHLIFTLTFGCMITPSLI